MPTYEYKIKKDLEGCDYCNESFEIEQKITDKPLKKCPECGEGIERLISESTFVLKGKGWYVDGYDKKPPKEKIKK